MSEIAIIIPALNEEQTIAEIIRGVKGLGLVIVVDDGSTDRTADIVRAEGAHVVPHQANQGYDGALRSGFLKALELGVDVMVTIDADGQHKPAAVAQLVQTLENTQADVVIGVRPKPARLSEALFRFYTKTRYGVQDALCGLKAYKAEAVRKHIDQTKIVSVGTAMPLSIVKAGGKLAEIPIEIRKRADKARIGGILKANWLIFTCMLRVMRL